MSTHHLLGGKVQVFKRKDSRFWQCSTTFGQKQHRTSTKCEGIAQARDFAEDWFLTLLGKDRAGVLISERTFKTTADQFLKEYTIITEGERSPRWVEGHAIRLRLHLLPFFGELGVSQVTSGRVQEYRMHRITTSKTGKAPARSTIHDEIVTLRQVLKTAIRHGWLTHLPDLSPPYKTQGKIVHRPWFSPAEYKQLYKATRAHAKEPFNRHQKWNAEQIHDFVILMANTGLRPDEAKNLQHRDIEIVEDEATGEKILEIEVRGKRGIGFCKSMPGAVRVYERLKNRPLPLKPQGKRARIHRGEDLSKPPEKEKLRYPQPMDIVFPKNQIKLFNKVVLVCWTGKRRS